MQGVFYKLGGMGDDARHLRLAPSGSGQGVEAMEVHRAIFPNLGEPASC